MDLDFWVKIATIFTPCASVIGLGWWLRGQFYRGREHTNRVMADHEAVEIQRFKDLYKLTTDNHNANVRRFSIIGIALTKIKPDLDLTDFNGA